jgi:cytochrome c oxidase cbb3-type subunit 3
LQSLPLVKHEVITKRLNLDPKMVKRGGKVFEKRCASCHAEKGHGIAGQGPRLNSPDFLGLASDHFIKETIREGRPGTSMASYKKSRKVKKEIDNLVAYIRSWQEDYAIFRKYDVDWTKKISGDVRSGKKIFRLYCASCHGTNGGGYADGGSGTAIGLSGFLSVAKDDYIKKTVLIGRAGTAMKAFGHGRGLATLPESDIDNVVAYLRSLE